LDVEGLLGAEEEEQIASGLGQPIGPRAFSYPGQAGQPLYQHQYPHPGAGELGYSAYVHPQVYNPQLQQQGRGSGPYSVYGSPGMYNGNGADLQFVLKLSGFFVLAAYAVLAIIFFLIMHLSRQREIMQYTRPQLTPRFSDDERARQYRNPNVLQGSAKASLQVRALLSPPPSAVVARAAHALHPTKRPRSSLRIHPWGNSVRVCACARLPRAR
jgi:hypothetical protein